MSPHFPLLLKARNEKFPSIGLKVTLCPSDDVIHKLLNAEIDFGFVTKHTGHPSVTFGHVPPLLPRGVHLSWQLRKSVGQHLSKDSRRRDISLLSGR